MDALEQALYDALYDVMDAVWQDADDARQVQAAATLDEVE